MYSICILQVGDESPISNLPVFHRKLEVQFRHIVCFFPEGYLSGEREIRIGRQKNVEMWGETHQSARGGRYECIRDFQRRFQEHSRYHNGFCDIWSGFPRNDSSALDSPLWGMTHLSGYTWNAECQKDSATGLSLGNDNRVTKNPRRFQPHFHDESIWVLFGCTHKKRSAAFPLLSPNGAGSSVTGDSHRPGRFLFPPGFLEECLLVYV